MVAALTNQKFPSFVYNDNWLVAVFVDKWVPGFHHSFKDSKGPLIPASQVGLYRRFFTEMGCVTTDIATIEACWSMIFHNGKPMKYKFICLFKVLKPISPHGAGAKYLFNAIKGYNKRMCK